MNYLVAKTIGLNTDQKASQVIYNFGSGENVFLAVLTLEGDDAFVFGRQLLSDLSSNFTDKEGSEGEKLTSTFEEAKKSLEGKQYSLLLASVATKVLYLIGVGDIAALLKRNESVSSLLNEGTGQLISGFLNEGDKVFLSTKSLSSFLGSNLQNSLKLPITEWEDEMSVRLNQEGGESGELAGLLIEVEKPPTPVAEGDDSLPEENIMPISNMEIPTRNVLNGVLGKVKTLLVGLLGILPKDGRIRLIAAVVIIVIILAGVGVKFIGAKNEQKNKEVTTLISQARSAKSEAENLKTLNATEAEKKLNEAKSLVTKALSLNSNSKEAQALKQELDNSTSEILQKFSSGDLTEFADLAKTKSGFRGSKLSLMGDNMVSLDLSGSLLRVSLNKDAKALAEKSDIGKATEILLDDDLVFVFSEDKGVLRVDLGSGKVTEVIDVDEDWGQIKGMSSFGGNIYLLDSSKNQVYKYLPTTSGFSSKRNYFTSDTKANLADAESLQIDSSVYILKGNGEILKFTKGAKDSFSLTGLDQPLKNPKAIFTSSEVENLYVLDSGNNRVVVLGKDGNYKAQYSAEKIGVVSSLVVDEKGKKIYLLEGSKVYTMDLK